MKQIDEILDDIKKYKNIARDIELANMLGVRQNTVSLWRSRKTIPYKKIISFCDKENLEINDVLNRDVSSWVKKEMITGEEKENVVKESPVIYNEGKNLDALVEKVAKIYKEGDLSERAMVRGMIDEIYDKMIEKITNRLKKGE